MDIVIHSATHLFCATDFRNSLRDLSDIDLLLREFGTDGGWWEGLIERGSRLGHSRPLAMALLHGQRALRTPVPPQILTRALKAAGRGQRHPLDQLVAKVLPPRQVSAASAAAAARAVLFVRGYFLDMPVRVLAIHLTHKLLSFAAIRRHGSERPEVV
jgi:hypothetical protein